MKKILFALVLITVPAAAGYLAFKPVPIRPVAYTVPANPGLTGPYANNTLLADLKTMKLGGEVGPETVAIGPDGTIYSAGESGNVYRINADGTGQRTLAYAGGRVLGMDFDSKGNLIAADAERGLLSITPDGVVYVLTNHFGGELLLFTDAVVVGKNGKIYYTDASTQFGPVKWGSTMEASILDLMDGTPTGRVFEFDPETKKIRLIAHGLGFANGITLSQDESSLIVNETGRFRVWKIATTANNLDIEKVDSQTDPQARVLLDNLPGYPDNLTRGTDGKIWLGFAAQRTNDLDNMATKPWLRNIVLRLPRAWWPMPKPFGHVMAFTEDGKVVQDLQDPSGAYPETTGVTETKDRLYIQSLSAQTLGWIDKK